MLITNGEGGLSVRLKLNDLIQKLFYSGRRYSKRSDFVADIAAGYSPIEGTIVTAGGCQYQAISGVADITDLPGFVPYKEITPKHFGAPWNGLSDDGPAVQAALLYAFSLGIAEVVFPFGVGRFDTQAVVLNTVDYRYITIRGAGKGTILRSYNSDGCIKIINTNRRTFVGFYDFDMSPMLEGSGTAIECTMPQGGTQGKRTLELRNINLVPEDYTKEGLFFWNDVLKLKGHRRPFLQNIAHFDPNGDDANVTPKRYAICNLDGCYFPHVETCYFNGVSERALTNDQEDTDGDGGAETREANEGGYFINTVMNGGDIGFHRSQPGRGAGMWFINCHINGRTKGAFIENNKYVVISGSLMYSRGDSASNYIDFHFKTCNNIHISGGSYRGFNANRRHIYFENCYDFRVEETGLAADVDIPPFYADANCENGIFIVPDKVTARDNASYPDQLVEIAPGATNVIWQRNGMPAGDNAVASTEAKRFGTTANATEIADYRYIAENSAGAEKLWAEQKVTIDNVTGGSERARYEIFLQDQGAITNALRVLPPTSNDETSMWLMVRRGGFTSFQKVVVGADNSLATGFAALGVPNPPTS